MKEPTRNILRDLVKLLKTFEGAEEALAEAEQAKTDSEGLKRELRARREEKALLEEQIAKAKEDRDEALHLFDVARVDAEAAVEAGRRKSNELVEAEQAATREKLAELAATVKEAQAVALKRRQAAEERAVAAEERVRVAEERLEALRAQLAE